MHFQRYSTSGRKPCATALKLFQALFSALLSNLGKKLQSKSFYLRIWDYRFYFHLWKLWKKFLEIFEILSPALQNLFFSPEYQPTSLSFVDHISQRPTLDGRENQKWSNRYNCFKSKYFLYVIVLSHILYICLYNQNILSKMHSQNKKKIVDLCY